MSQLTIRRALPSDVETIKAIAVAAESFDVELFDVEEVVEVVDEIVLEVLGLVPCSLANLVSSDQASDDVSARAWRSVEEGRAE